MTDITIPTEKPKPLIKSEYEYNNLKEWMLDLHQDPDYDIDVIMFWQKQLTAWEDSQTPLVD